MGRYIETLIEATQPAGNYNVEFEGTNLQAAFIFIRLKQTNLLRRKKWSY